jgi:hypothetical protein
VIGLGLGVRVKVRVRVSVIGLGLGVRVKVRVRVIGLGLGVRVGLLWSPSSVDPKRLHWPHFLIPSFRNMNTSLCVHRLFIS